MEKNMENPTSVIYDKIDPEEIIARLKRILEYIQSKSKDKPNNGHECTTTPLS